MRTISPNEIAVVNGAGVLGVTLGRVENVGTQVGGALISIGLALNDAVFSVVQLQNKDAPIQLGQLTKLI